MGAHLTQQFENSVCCEAGKALSTKVSTSPATTKCRMPVSLSPAPSNVNNYLHPVGLLGGLERWILRHCVNCEVLYKRKLLLLL